MNWPEFLGLQNAWLLALVPPLIILYFLKLKRPRLEIPSLALWRSVLNDQRVNSPLQRFKRNLLLLLQLILLVCLVLAAMQPIFSGGADRAKYLPVLIDCSASMAARAAPGGPSRLDVAKQEVRKLIDNLLPSQRLSLIAVSSTARRLTDFTDNQRVLRDALAQLEVVPVASRLEDALRMTQALARTVNVETVVLFTDGNVPAIVDFELPFQLNFQKLPAAGPNLGITAVNGRRQREQWDVFVRVDGSHGIEPADQNAVVPSPPGGGAGRGAAANDSAAGGPHPNPLPQGEGDSLTTAAVQLLQNGRVVGDEVISLAAGQSQRIVFHVEAGGHSSLEVRLKPDGFDSLDLDNTAWLDLPAGRMLSVYCPADLSAFRHALSGLEGLATYPDDNGDGRAASYDLVISDKKGDAGLESGVFVFTGVIPDDLQKLVRLDGTLAEVVDWQRSAPLLQHVLLAEVQIAEQPVAAEGVRDRDFEELGYEVLAHGRRGPLVLRKDPGGRPQYYLLFHIDRSTLPYRVGFPILVSNALQIAMQQAGLSETRGVPAGVLPEMAVIPDSEFRIVAPDGSATTARSNADGILAGVPGPAVGQYTIEREGARVAAVGVSLLAGSESSLTTVDRLQFPELAVGAATELLKSDRPNWPWLAVFGFLVLLAEWWVFQKRPGGLPVRSGSTS
ncbi:MAG: vWA domain-containing protein [Planctomycetaceae bacterium]